MFKTQYDKRFGLVETVIDDDGNIIESKRFDRTETNAGARIAPTYSLSSKNNLEQTGEKDIYSEIQSHAESCDIKMLLARLDLGDRSMMRTSQFMDVTSMPTTLAEMQSMVIKATNEFNELPIEIRREYDFNAEEYIKDIGSDKWLKLFGKKEELPLPGKADPIPGVEENKEV